jgi:hypothetical protein
MDNEELRREILALAAKLSEDDRREVARQLLSNDGSEQPKKRLKWSDLAGRASYPMCGEDAQQWVSRSRRESDEHRERGLRRPPS